MIMVGGGVLVVAFCGPRPRRAAASSPPSTSASASVPPTTTTSSTSTPSSTTTTSTAAPLPAPTPAAALPTTTATTTTTSMSPPPPPTELRHITSNAALAPPMRDRTSSGGDRSNRQSQYVNVSGRLGTGTRSPGSIPSSPTSVCVFYRFFVRFRFFRSFVLRCSQSSWRPGRAGSASVVSASVFHTWFHPKVSSSTSMSASVHRAPSAVSHPHRPPSVGALPSLFIPPIRFYLHFPIINIC